MIDRKAVIGTLGRPLSHHQACLSKVRYSRFLQSKIKPTTTFVSSPLTGAQIEVLYWVEAVDGIPTAFVRIKIPLASATVGHNYLHAGLGSIRYEVQCAALLVKVTLTVLGFRPEEITRFMKTSRPPLLELTWHTPTASKRARLSLQRRTKAYFDAQRSISGRHDVGVTNVHYNEGDGKPGLLVELKGGDRFRQYGKADHVRSRSQKDRKQAFVSDEARKYRPMILAAIEHHARNEILVGLETLQQFGCEHPASWTADTLKAVIDHVWAAMGLAPRRSNNSDTDTLSPEAEETWERYLDREDVEKELPPHTFSRHRAQIKEAKGEDIALPRKSRAVRPERLGHQLSYERRWEPEGDLRKLVLCEVTAPAIIRELEWGLAFLETGEFPSLDGEPTSGHWRSRWTEFIEREGGGRHVPE